VFLAGTGTPGNFPPTFHVDREHRGDTGFHGDNQTCLEERPEGTVVAYPDGWDSKKKAETVFAEKEKVRLNYVGSTRPESMLSVTIIDTDKAKRWSAFKGNLADAEPLEVPAEVAAVAPEKVPGAIASPADAADAIRSRLASNASETYRVRGAKDLAQEAAGTAGSEAYARKARDGLLRGPSRRRRARRWLGHGSPCPFRR